MEFTIRTREVYLNWYAVDAETEEEALAKFENGGAHFSHTSDVIDVEVLEVRP